MYESGPNTHPSKRSEIGTVQVAVLEKKMKVWTVALLVVSNIFMTAAWYGHLKFRSSALWKVIVIRLVDRFCGILFPGSREQDRVLPVFDRAA